MGLTLMLLQNLNLCLGMVEDMAMEDTGDANVVMLTLMQLQNLNPCLGMVEDMDMVDTGDGSVERLKLMLKLKLRPRHTTICTILITMSIQPIIMLGNDLLMPNLSHGGEDMDTAVVEDTGVVKDAPPRLILCHGGMADITEDTGDKNKENTEFSLK